LHDLAENKTENAKKIKYHQFSYIQVESIGWWFCLYLGKRGPVVILKCNRWWSCSLWVEQSLINSGPERCLPVIVNSTRITLRNDVVKTRIEA